MLIYAFNCLDTDNSIKDLPKLQCIITINASLSSKRHVRVISFSCPVNSFHCCLQ